MWHARCEALLPFVLVLFVLLVQVFTKIPGSVPLFTHCLKGVEATGRLHLKYDGTHSETRFRLSAKRTSPFKSAGAAVHSTAGSRGVRVSGSNAGYAMLRGGVESIGYPLHSPVSPSLPLMCITVCHHISTGVYHGEVLTAA